MALKWYLSHMCILDLMYGNKTTGRSLCDTSQNFRFGLIQIEQRDRYTICTWPTAVLSWHVKKFTAM